MHPAPPSSRPTPRARFGRLAGLLTSLVVLVPTVASAVPIESFGGYQPQTRCNPTAKPGTLELAEWLITHYPGTGSMGISRACGHGGVSEHKEGRAFDWAVNHSSGRDRAYVKDFLAKLLAPDAEGNPAALARRMGIMYLIWNDHVYASYRQFAKRDYVSSGCRSKRRCSANLRHRNHVHISLTRAGGQGRTSWFQRGEDIPAPPPTTPPPTTPTTPPAPPAPPVPPAPPPPLTPEPPPPTPGPAVKGELKLNKKRPFARIRVPLDGSTYKSRWKLRQGKKYKLTVAGVVGFGRPDQVADAVCAWSPTARTWQPGAEGTTGTGGGSPDVAVNSDRVFGDRCRGGHKYTTRFVPTKSKRLRVKVRNLPAEGSGRLVLTVSRKGTDVTRALPEYPTLVPAPTARMPERGVGLLAETVSLPAGSPDGATTVQEVKAGARYRVTVSGVVDLGRGVQSDGQCIAIDGQWYPQASLDRRRPGKDHGSLYLDGQPLSAPTGDCSAHHYVADHTATQTGRLRLELWDPRGPSGNAGSLNVTVQRLSAFRTPRKANGRKPERNDAWTQGRDWFTVGLADRKGTVSTMRVRKGERVQVLVAGTYTSHGVTADASCVATPAGWARRDPSLLVEQDPLELWVDGTLLHWRVVGAGEGCSDAAHTYATSYVATKSGPVRLAVHDLDHSDNAGSLEVTLLR